MLPLMALMAMGSSKYDQRAADWRNGAIVYQVFVDRFAPSKDFAAKRALYPPPGLLKNWSDLPKPSAYDPKIGTYPHVMEFWGGDLASLRSRLDYVKNLGIDVLYLQPIFKSPSNHKYDTEDYFQIDPQYGTQADLDGLIRGVHRSKMKLVLDGVFNHIGETSKIFQTAKAGGPHRDWFTFGKKFPNGYRGWAGVKSLPGLKIENPAVRDYLWNAKGSVVKKYLKQGIDGWRLDVGFELGPRYLSELTHSAHAAKPGSLVIGEILGYPSDWQPSVDAVFNFFALTMAEHMLKGELSGGTLGQVYEEMVADAGVDHLLKSWLSTDNHDTDRFASIVPDPVDRHLIRALQFTLPGSPCLFYGSELGEPGVGDPGTRVAMDWGLVNDTNPDLKSTRSLVKARKSLRALRVGDFKRLTSEKLLAFVRTTDKLADTVFVVVNPTKESVHKVLSPRVGRLMNWGSLRDVLNGGSFVSKQGVIVLTMPPRSVKILVPDMAKNGGYSPYDRINRDEGKG